jgi:hypothetical protein
LVRTIIGCAASAPNRLVRLVRTIIGYAGRRLPPSAPNRLVRLVRTIIGYAGRRLPPSAPNRLVRLVRTIIGYAGRRLPPSAPNRLVRLVRTIIGYAGRRLPPSAPNRLVRLVRTIIGYAGAATHRGRKRGTSWQREAPHRDKPATIQSICMPPQARTTATTVNPTETDFGVKRTRTSSSFGIAAVR